MTWTPTMALADLIAARIAVACDFRACRNGMYGHERGRIIAVARYGVQPPYGRQYLFQPNDPTLRRTWRDANEVKLTHCMSRQSD